MGDNEEKVMEGEGKRGELMGEKLKRAIFTGKREGNSTPSPTWKLGLVQSDGTIVPDFNFSPIPNALSARKLGANLWEMQPQFNPRAAKMSKNGSNLNHHRKEERVSNEFDEVLSQSSSKQPMSGIDSRKQLAAASRMQHNLRVERVAQAQQPISPASYCSSMEMAPRRPAISPNSSLVSSNGKFGESSHGLKTSTELLKVLNRIWSLEEKHALDMSLVQMLRKELDQSQARVQELLQDKERDGNKINNLTKQVTEYKVARKREQDRIKDAVKLVENKLEDELKLRRHSEKRHNKVGKELLEMKSLFSNALRELEWERKARTLLEDLCDEFAEGIREYEQEVRFAKHKSCKDPTEREGNDRLILHISEAWLDERAQIKKLANGRDISALDKLCVEIEAFLRAKQSGKKNDCMSLESPSESDFHSPSLESLHLNEPASAPWNGNNEEDSISIGNHCSQFCRGVILKQAKQEATKSKPTNERVQSSKGSYPDQSSSQTQPEEHARNHQLVNEESTKSRMENLYHMNSPRMPKKGETIQRSCREGRKSRIADAVDVDLQETRTRNQSEDNCMEGSFDPSTFAGPPSPVKKWTSDVSAAYPEISQSPSRWQKSIKPNTLKAKLMEARLEGRHSRARSSIGSLRVD